jgi:TolA-binding protein
MRMPMAGAVMLALAGALAPASAQTQRLPLQSRSEREVQDVNRSLMRQQQDLRQNQQTQFEVNQLRGEIQRSQQFPPVTGPGISASCPPGSIC